MYKIIIIALFVIFMVSNVFALELTREQFKNLDLLHSYLKGKYPTFQGFNGSQVSMNVLGIDERIVKKELKTLDINQLKENDLLRKKKRKLRNKFKLLGLDDEDLNILKLQNDIPD